MTADKRTVHTDALETLGTLIGPNEKRDAIHLAVIPAIAGEPLPVGADVGIVDGKAYHWFPTKFVVHVGIVDPFLKENMVKAGDRFWLVIYPRKITSLRHVWSHPAFPDETPTVTTELDLSNAHKLIEDAAKDAGFDSVDALLEAIDAGLSSGYVDAPFGREPDTKLNEEFWKAWSLVTGKPLLSNQYYPSYFSCSC